MTSMNAQKKSYSELLPLLPWKTRLMITAYGTITDFCSRSNGTVNRGLIKLLDPIIKVPPRTTLGVKVSDITVDSKRGLWFRVFVPTKVPRDSKLPVIVYFHGGGFVFLSPDLRQFDTLCRQFALKARAVVVSVNYRLAPEHRCPAQYEDGFDVVKFLDTDYFAPNVDLSRCFLAGDSAGGNLAHNVARRITEAEAETEFSNITLRGLITVQPAFSGKERSESEIRLKDTPFLSFEHTDWYFKAFLPKGEDRDHEAVNVFGPNSIDISGLKNFPPALVVVGGMDPLGDWQKRYYEGLKRHGRKARLVEYPNGIHGFFLFPELPETSLLVMEVAEFIHNQGDALK